MLCTGIFNLWLTKATVPLHYNQKYTEIAIKGSDFHFVQQRSARANKHDKTLTFVGVTTLLFVTLLAGFSGISLGTLGTADCIFGGVALDVAGACFAVSRAFGCDNRSIDFFRSPWLLRRPVSALLDLFFGGTVAAKNNIIPLLNKNT